MKCQAHPTIDATRSCHACLQVLCNDCTQEVRGTFYCDGCLDERLQPDAQAQALPPRPPKRKRIKTPFVSGFLSALIPGLGQVYNGLLGRALFVFIGFLLLTWSVDQVGHSGEGLIGIVILAYLIWQVVDAFRTAKDINALGRVPDPEEAAAMGRGSIPGLNEGSKGLGVGMMVLGGFLLLGNLGLSRMLTQLIEGIWPVALLVGGIWLVRRSRAERRAARPSVFDELDEEYELAAEGMDR